MIRRLVKQALRPDSIWWRRAIRFGVDHGPDPFVRHSPPLFGVAWALALPDKRRRVRDNLRRIRGVCSPLEESLQVAEVFGNYASCLTEALLLGSSRGYAISSRPKGLEHYHACAGGGKGVILATAHTGGWEVSGPTLRGIHPGLVVVAMQRERDDEARSIQDHARKRTGVTVAHIGDSPFDALPLLGHLRKQAAVAIQVDRVPPGMRGREVRFFGGAWMVPEGVLTLASLSGAPIMPIFTRRVGFMDYEAIVTEGITLPRRPTEAQRTDAAQRIADALERFVAMYPTQWFHFDDAPPIGGAPLPSE